MDRSEVFESQAEDREMGNAPSTSNEQNEIREDQAMGEETQLFPLTDECYHYTCKEDFEWDTQKWVNPFSCCLNKFNIHLDTGINATAYGLATMRIS